MGDVIGLRHFGINMEVAIWAWTVLLNLIDGSGSWLGSPDRPLYVKSTPSRESTRRVAGRFVRPVADPVTLAGIVMPASVQQAIIAPPLRRKFAVGPGSTRDLVVWSSSILNKAWSILESVRIAGGTSAIEGACQRVVDVADDLYQEVAMRGEFVHMYHYCNELSKLIPTLASASSDMGRAARYLGDEIGTLATLHEQAFAMLDFERRGSLDFKAHHADNPANLQRIRPRGR